MSTVRDKRNKYNFMLWIIGLILFMVCRTQCEEGLLTISGSDEQVHLHTDAVLKCEVKGENIKMITWKKGTTPVAKSHRYTVRTKNGKTRWTSQLMISDVTYSDAATYKCIATTKDGTQQSSRIILTLLDSQGGSGDSDWLGWAGTIG